MPLVPALLPAMTVTVVVTPATVCVTVDACSTRVTVGASPDANDVTVINDNRMLQDVRDEKDVLSTTVTYPSHFEMDDDPGGGGTGAGDGGELTGADEVPRTEVASRSGVLGAEDDVARDEEMGKPPGGEGPEPGGIGPGVAPGCPSVGAMLRVIVESDPPIEDGGEPAGAEGSGTGGMGA